MAVYTTPTETRERYVEKDAGNSAAGIWAVVAVLLVLFAILFFGTNVFGNQGSDSATDINIRGSVETPGTGGNSGGSTGGSGAQ